MRRDRAGVMASTTSLTAVLFLLAVVLLAGHNIRGQARSLEGRKGLDVFLADDVTPERVRELEASLKAFGEIAQVEYRSRESALEEVQRDLGGVDVIGALGENPLSPSFLVHLTAQAAA